MKLAVAFVTLSLSLGALAEASSIKIIYGSDDRLDIRDVTDARLLEVASATAAKIPQWKLSAYSDPTIDPIIQDMMTLSGSARVCGGERFATQPTLADCSGFLVGEKTLVTAGHCVDLSGSCGPNVWVFDYNLDTPGVERPLMEATNTYSCARVIRSELNERTKMDYAVIELDRPVVGRQPLRIRRRGKPGLNAPLVVIGHPSGLPTKIAGGGRILRRKKNYFGANLDTYGGNSGSAVFHARTLEVEGILVRGDEDYVNSAEGCRISNVVARARGSEEVQRITKVPGI